MSEKKKKPAIGIGAVILLLFVAGMAGFYFYRTNKAGMGMSMPGETAGGHNSTMETATVSAVPAPVVTSGDTVTLSERARQMAGVQTARAAVRNLTRAIRTTGKVAMNETRRAYITSRVEGRIDVLHISAEGEYISPGQIIARVYSPAFIAAQEEYLHALENRERFANAEEAVSSINTALTQAARRKLELLNMSAGDIQELERNRKSQELMPVYAQFGGTVIERLVLPGAYIRSGDRLFNLSSLSSVWINTAIYEKDIASVRVNQDAEISSQAYPGGIFRGRVAFISPVLDDTTRTVQVRVELDNQEGKLRPNMFVNVDIKVLLGESIIVPESALLDSGNTQVVFLARDESTFVRREVQAGHYANGYVQIISGLEPNDYVVSAAAFLIDSQTKLGDFSSHGGHGGSAGGAH
jgi:Cu(I)/Ag(I) efflux system membrane fusion protein